MFEVIKSTWQDKKGSFATMFAVSILGLALIAGIAVDLSRLQSTKIKAQDQLDSALLAAARSMSDAKAGQSRKKRLKRARKIARQHLAFYEAHSGYKLSLRELKLKNNALTATATTKSVPYFANLLGVKTLDVNVASAANIAVQQAKNVDVVLISDATGSMQTTLDAIQDNMKKFTGDLSAELTSSNIKLGKVRVQFIFYRDYMIDNHKDWAGPKMTLQPGLEGKGPMYISPFFKVPQDKNKMDRYVDYFIADGGGSFRESGLEAVWQALNTDWRNGDKTVRSIVLWTDAQTRPLGDTEEISLTPVSGTGYWTDTYWRAVMGDWFNALTKQQREVYMHDKYYPKDMPGTLSGIKAKFAEFHRKNSNGVAGVKTMSINVISNCWGVTVCTDWPELATWDGIDLTIEPSGLPSNETYHRIVKQVAETVVSQVTAKDIAITH